ncbi:MAG: RHS repeat protein [bacterium]|nr:RHS repeat protein [bacterium]
MGQERHLRSTDAAGQLTTFDYDALDRLTEVSVMPTSRTIRSATVCQRCG